MRRSTVRIMFVSCILLAGLSQAAYFDYLQVLPAEPPIPASNPLTETKATLGKRLYFDTRLSRDGQQSCNSCHDLARGGDDDQAFSIGQSGQPTRRSAPGLWNIGFQTVLYWDGRAVSHETQIVDHLQDPAIMGIRDVNALLERLRDDPEYPRLFAKAFGAKADINPDTIAMAIASFERTLLTPDSRFDHYLRGEKEQLSEQEQHGMQLFNDVGCLSCHFGVNFAGPAPGPALGLGDGFYELFPNYAGTRYDQELGLLNDLGRYEFSGDPGEKRMWRVPPLRNIELTAPYFHNGSAATLEQAVKVMAKTQLDRELNEKEITAIAAFLRSLTGVRPALKP